MTRAYWALLTAAETVRVVDESLVRTRAHLVDARNQLEAGLAAPNDVLTVEAQESRQRMLGIQARANRDVAEAELGRLVGVPPGTPVQPVTALDPPSAVNTDLASLVEIARQSRPERAALLKRVEGATDRGKAAAAGNATDRRCRCRVRLRAAESAPLSRGAECGPNRGTPASTHTRLPFRTFIRIFSAKVPTSAKESMMSMHSKPRFEGRVPENALLSHDLFEGIFARAGLVTDIEFFEEFPSHYEVAKVRQYRWARGDWQLLPWIIGHGPDTSGAKIRGSIPLIGRWKMLDNLRRALLAPAAFFTLIAGWTLPFASPLTWTVFILACIAIPPLLHVLIGAIPRRRGISKRSHARAVGTDLALAGSHMVLTVIFLADQAWLMTDAIVRTLSRVYVTRRKFLEWVTAAQAKSDLDLSLSSCYRRMSRPVALAVTVGILVVFHAPDVWPIAAPFTLLWALSPMVAYWTSLPPRAAAAQPLSEDEVRTLQLTARRTWRFFETFVGPEDHALPPDNFQEEPTPVVAHRTSPTNLGLYLLSTVAAHDFGWIGTVATIERLEATLGTMNGLERFRGHFYNWYDTRDLRPLDPKYISSVDSGNLAGHLIALGQACQEIIERPLLGPHVLSGIADAILLLRQSAARSSTTGALKQSRGNIWMKPSML